MDDQETENQKWMALSNRETRVRLGLVYAPQESVTKINDLRIMYNQIEEQVKQAIAEDSELIVCGDFNCKVGEMIRGNRDTVKKGGRLLMKMIRKYNLEMVNASEVCKGLWTRVVGEEKSVIDYVLTRKGFVGEMRIDEGRENTPFRLIEREQVMVYSDHNAIEFEGNMVTSRRQKYKIMTTNSYIKYQEELIKKGIDQMFKDKTSLQETYNLWMKLVENSLGKSRIKVSANKVGSKQERVIRRIKRGLKRRTKGINRLRRTEEIKRKNKDDEHAYSSG